MSLHNAYISAVAGLAPRPALTSCPECRSYRQYCCTCYTCPRCNRREPRLDYCAGCDRELCQTCHRDHKECAE